MKKALMSLLIGSLLLTGCMSHESEDHTSHTKENDMVTENKTFKSQYFEVDDNDYIDISHNKWTMCIPENKTETIGDSVRDYVVFKLNNGKQVSCYISLDELNSEEQRTYTLEMNREKFENERTYLITLMETPFHDSVYEENYISTTVSGKKALMDKGVATCYEGKEKYNYAVFEFFLDDEGKFPCELMTTSHDSVSADDLEAIAREFISSIEKQ